MSITFEQDSLPNGLNVIGEIDDNAHTAAIGFFVKTGARDELSKVMGVSHFLEHMMFKGTNKRSAEEVDQEFDDIGAEHNAFTTSEMTAFWAHTLPEHLLTAEEILSDIMRPAIRQADFDSEKRVILEEIAMYADYPFWVLYEKAMETYYREHPLSHRVLGTVDSITGLTREQMVDYFTNRYSADNAVIAVAGKVDFEALMTQISMHCGNWNTSRTSRAYQAPQFAPDEFTMNSASVHRHYMLMLCPAPGQQDPRRYASSILAQILGDSEGSRLYWALVETGLAEEAQSQYESRDGVGDVLVFASCSPENAQTVEVTIEQQLERLVESLTQDDLERVRSKIATGVTLHSELPAGRMKRIGRVWTYTGEYRSLATELERINAVTLDDLRAVADEFPIRPIVRGHLTPA
jgi:predicted Zn-dependent peptidase